jgi:phospholipid/cholesterol/gamma-HCH transport system ATP-binding protein
LALIRFDRVSKSLLGRLVLNDVSFEVAKGASLAIVGPSGAGKSVTLKHMICLLRPDVGSVEIGGDAISEARGSELDRIRRRFGVLFQSSALLEWLTVAENVALPLREKTAMSEEDIISTVNERLRLVGLEEDREKHPSELSGGMKKRAGLARALAEDPEIVLYDEPTSGLDPVSARSIDNLINTTRKDLGVTSVVVTHDLHSALSVGTSIAMIYRGAIVEMCSPSEFVRSENDIVQQFLKAQYITDSGAWEIKQ